MSKETPSHDDNDNTSFSSKRPNASAASVDFDELPAHKRRYVQPTGNESLTAARRGVLDLTAQIGKTQLIPAGAGVGRRGRGAGIYCEACDLTFKDNLQWVEHINSMQHLVKTGQTAKVRRATAEEVIARIDYWVQKLDDEKKEHTTSLEERLKVREREREQEAEERRERKKQERAREREKKEADNDKKKDYGEGFRIEGEHDEEDMMAAFGFTAFGSSKK
jgi:U4/U6.U5 tri-snRNP component SNU23